MSYDLYKWSYNNNSGPGDSVWAHFWSLMVGFVTNNPWCWVILNHWVSQFQRANGVSTNQHHSAGHFCDLPDLFWNAKTWKTWPKIPKSQVGWELVTLFPKKNLPKKIDSKVDEFSAWDFCVSQNKKLPGSKKPTSFVHLLPAAGNNNFDTKKRSENSKSWYNFLKKINILNPKNGWFVVDVSPFPFRLSGVIFRFHVN